MRPSSPQVRQVAEQSRELVAADRLDENAELLRDAVRRFPEEAEVHLLAAAAVRAVGSDEEGERLTRRAGELAWDDPHRLTWAASQMLDIGDLDTAQAWILRIHEVVPDDFEMAADLARVVGRLARGRGQEEEAEKLLGMADELDADLAGARLRSALQALQGGEGSVQDVRRALHASEVCIPHSGAPGDTEITIATMSGGQAIPLFTAPDAMGPGHAHLRVPFEALAPRWPEGVDAVLDPGSEWALRLPDPAAPS
jgi:tetratricopeptide (TPR) repeat protein